MVGRQGVRRVGAAILGVFALSFARAAAANGDDFFQRSDAPLSSQLIFVGTVKDDEGNRIDGVLVTWRATFFDDNEEQSTFAGTYTDLMGRFRTVDLVRTFAMNGYPLDPARVEVTVSKPGYTMTRRLKRARHDQHMGLIEVNFEMARERAKP